LGRILAIQDQIELIPGSLESYPSIYKAISGVKPDEIYHLAAQSFVSYSFEDEFSTLQSNISGTHFMLSAVKDIVPDCRFYFAASSEMFGKVMEVPQKESTPFYPRSPYGVAKVYGHWITVNYRESYDLFAVSGILFNHESPRRGLEFVTRKITDGVARIKLGMAKQLALGNLDSRRDWGYAKDYVHAMWLMLQQDKPDDYVVGTGETKSVRDFCDAAFSHVGLNYEDYVVQDPRFYRPAEVDLLVSDPSKARKVLGWEPTVRFEELVSMMVDADMARLSA
jgi:GDPmannose 4,6-dehydratase